MNHGQQYHYTPPDDDYIEDVHDYGGAPPKKYNNNQASGLADFYDEVEANYDEEAKVECVSHTCAQAVSEARMAKNMTQAQLANRIGEKTSVVVDIENATGPYNAAIINSIEK